MNSQVEFRVDLFTVERAMFSLTRSKLLVQAAIARSTANKSTRSSTWEFMWLCGFVGCMSSSRQRTSTVESEYFFWRIVGLSRVSMWNEGCVPGVIHLQGITASSRLSRLSKQDFTTYHSERHEQCIQCIVYVYKNIYIYICDVICVPSIVLNSCFPMFSLPLIRLLLHVAVSTSKHGEKTGASADKRLTVGGGGGGVGVGLCGCWLEGGLSIWNLLNWINI